MNIDKNITIDLNRVQPVKVIRIHEGDVNSVRLVLKITKDNTAFSLTGISVKYDAVIAGYLAEGDANGSISDGKVIIPVTKNMTAMSGLLQVDVKLIEGTAVVFTQTLTLLVDRAVINEETIIDFSGTTIGQRIENIEATLETKADSASVYTKSQVDTKLGGKQNHLYRNISNLSECDEMNDPQTVYRFYYNGTYQLMLCTSPTGAQYRFLKSGEIYFREYNVTTNVWGDWKSIYTKIPDETLLGRMLEDYTIPYEKLEEDYVRYFNTESLDDADTLLKPGIYTGTATQSWQTQYDVYGDYIMIGDFSRQLLIFPSDNRVFTRYHTKTAYVDRWSDWVDLSSCTLAQVQTLLGSYYTSSAMDTMLSQKMGYIEVYGDTPLSNCDLYLTPGILYRLYINNTYQLLLNTYALSCQYRFTRTGEVFFRNYNNTSGQWSDWQLITTHLADGSVTYDKLSEDYIRFYAEADIDNCNNFLNYAIYSGSASAWWATNFGISGRYTMIADFYAQFVFFAEEGRIFYRKHTKQYASDYWSAWQEISYYTKDEADTLLYQKADIEYGFVGTNYAWYTDPSQGLSLTGSYSLIGNYCHLAGQAPLIQGWERVYYSLPVACVDSGATIALNGNNNFSIATGEISNTSVLEIKQMGSSSMPSGTVRFTLIYRYK